MNEEQRKKATVHKVHAVHKVHSLHSRPAPSARADAFQGLTIETSRVHR